jgi:hypothetical protein
MGIISSFLWAYCFYIYLFSLPILYMFGYFIGLLSPKTLNSSNNNDNNNFTYTAMWQDINND